MYKFPDDFQPEIDYWIFCKQHDDIYSAKETLLDIISYDKITEQHLVDIVHAYRKVVRMSQEEFSYITNLLMENHFEETQLAFSTYQTRSNLYDR